VVSADLEHVSPGLGFVSNGKERIGIEILAEIARAMEPMNLTCMLFSAIRKEIRRPASRRASLIRIKGSINYK
jgi:hypothetical protein